MIATLYGEELKAVTRGRFAWAGAAVILLAVGGVAAVGTQDTWLDGYGIVAYGLVPLGFIPIAAMMMASPRANRFVEQVFTAPVRRGEWFAAKLLVLFTLAAAYYIALMPMMLVYVGHVGMPLLLKEFLAWTPALLLISVCVGALIGVLFIGRSLAAPAGASMGVLLAYAGLVPLQELLVAQDNGATRSGHLTLISPAVLSKNALGFALVAHSVPAATAMTWVSLAVVVIGSLALAAYVYLKAQGVETWEATRAQKWIIALSLGAMILFPAFFADTNYDRPAPSANSAPSIARIFARAGSSLALVAKGAAMPVPCCGTILNRDEWPYGTDMATERDLLLLLPVDSEHHVQSIKADVSGENGLKADAAPEVLNPAEPRLEKQDYAGDSGPAGADGRHIASGWVMRIPVTLTPTQPWDIGGDRYPLKVSANYQVEGEQAPRVFSARAAIDAQVSSAIYEMALAGGILPALCLFAAFLRWRRTR
jgi:hypothetical protein